jgi:hypothetical protein
MFFDLHASAFTFERVVTAFKNHDKALQDRVRIIDLPFITNRRVFSKPTTDTLTRQAFDKIQYINSFTKVPTTFAIERNENRFQPTELSVESFKTHNPLLMSLPTKKRFS